MGSVGMPGGGVMNSGAASELKEILDGQHGNSMSESFKEFSNRPENRKYMVKHQQSELRKAARLNHKMRALEFKEKVLQADYEAQKNVAPFLDNRVLRQVVQTFCNDPRNDFNKWATNPLIIRMLTNAKKALDEGRTTEEEMEHMIMQQLQDPNNAAHWEWKQKTQQVARLATDQLIPALNEHLTERRRGNDLYKRFNEAMEHYQRALSICEFVVGMSSMDQKEIDTNKIMVQLNIAAVHIALKDYGAAIEIMSESHGMDPKNVKIILRRAKAYIGRREYKLAEADLDLVKELEPWNHEAEEEVKRLKRMKKKDLQGDKKVAKEIFQEC